METFVSSLHC